MTSVREGQPRAGYGIRIREIDASRRPRERLARDGTSSLSDHELLALILRSGSAGQRPRTRPGAAGQIRFPSGTL